MTHALIEELHRYFSNIGSPTEEEKSLLIQLTGELPYFKVTSVHRDDLRMEGFDVSGVSDADMEELARSLGKDYVNQLFWGSLKIIAGDFMKIPLDKNASCPKCTNKGIGYDVSLRQYTCKTCGQQWSDIYVLVEFPDDSSFFENNDIGYPCFNSEDNGARYVLEYDYLKHFQKEPPENAYFRPVQWSESQKYMQEKEDENEPDDSILALCELVMDEEALEKFGFQSMWVPLCMINDNGFRINNSIVMEYDLKISETEGEMIEIHLSPEITPVAYERKVRCLMLSGFTEEEAKGVAMNSLIQMEIFYSIGRGLFAVESESVAYIPIYNPYTGEEIPKVEETEDPKD